jgi:hypothetical protein
VSKSAALANHTCNVQELLKKKPGAWSVWNPWNASDMKKLEKPRDEQQYKSRHGEI